MKLNKLVLLFIVIAAVACKPKDEDLTQSVQTAIESIAPGILASTTDGVVTLTGMVENEALVSQLAAAAQSVPILFTRDKNSKYPGNKTNKTINH